MGASNTQAERDRAAKLAERVTVGIVTALEEERAAMLAMLERPVSWSAVGKGAGLVYDLGEITANDGGIHVVALALADMGNNIAAVRGTLLLQHFPNVEAIVMVGIAGGVPNPNKASEHVRLGDVVVSDRRGVIQYDFKKKGAGAIDEVRASPRPPHARLLEAVRLLNSDALSGSRPWEAHIRKADHFAEATRPDTSRDVLLASKTPFAQLEHPSDSKRIDGQPRIFTGVIASANTLLKDPVVRDRLREKHGAKAVEMEGSGIADATWNYGVGYLVVRGICDYCDKNKNDDWHMYAAIVAGAYTRAVLERMGSGEPPEPESIPVSPQNTPQPPHNLRSRNTFFRGRHADLATLETALRNEKQTTITHASVFGLGGVGKSALALEFAHRAVLNGDYPGGVWWVHAEGKPVDKLGSLAPVLRMHAPDDVRRRMPENETNAELIADAVRLALQGQQAKSLLILDNLSETGWGSLVPGGNVSVLVTTLEERLALGSVHPLNVLTSPEARELAQAITGVALGDAESQALERVLIDELGGLAVAVEMAARGVKKWCGGSWITYERMLRAEMDRMLTDPRVHNDDYGRGVFAALDLSINRCDEEARALLEGLAIFAPERVPLGWAQQAAGITAEGPAARALATLHELGLVTQNEAKDLVSLHRLVFRQVRKRAETERGDVWREASGRGAKAAATWINGAVELTQTRNEMEAVERRQEHVEQALDAANRAGDLLVWVQMANQLAIHLQNRAQYTEARALFEQGLAKAERLVPPEPSQVAMVLSNLATVLLNLGGAAGATLLMERALAIAEKTFGTKHPAVAISLSNLAMGLQDMGEMAGAKLLMERALAIHENTFGPEHPNVAIGLSNLAMLLTDLGDAPGARPLMERALAIDENTFGTEHPTMASSLSNLAVVLQDLGDAAGARPLMERALAIHENTFGTEHPKVAVSLSNLALVLHALGDAAGARPLLERALAIVEARLPAGHPHQRIFRDNLAALGPDVSKPRS